MKLNNSIINYKQNKITNLKKQKIIKRFIKLNNYKKFYK